LKVELEDLNDDELNGMFEDLWVFDESKVDDENEKDEKEVKFTEELWEENNYLVLFFDNTIDWLQAQTIFDLEPVKALDSRPWYERIGLGRVIPWNKFIQKILDSENK
jgi:hypothetical protein